MEVRPKEEFPSGPGRWVPEQRKGGLEHWEARVRDETLAEVEEG